MIERNQQETLPSSEPIQEDLGTCDYCHSVTPLSLLFRHEETNELLCFGHLVYYLETDIEDSEDHTGKFEGWVFFKISGIVCDFYGASFQDQYFNGTTLDEVLTKVLQTTGKI